MKQFLWGATLSANQYEGQTDRDLSNVDMIPRGEYRYKVSQGSIDPYTVHSTYPGRIGVKGYEHYLEDIKLLFKLGIRCFRFSISWSRVYREGILYKKGLAYYEKIVDTCLSYNIEPIITINHFDVPLYYIQKFGSWRDRQMINAYLELCQTLFQTFQGKVHYWITFNEMNMILHMPYMSSGITFDKGENHTQVIYQCAHHELIASALAVKLAHSRDKNNKIGCMLASGHHYPYTCHPEDVLEAYKDDRENYLFADVQVKGYYPHYIDYYFKKHNISIDISKEDREILRQGTVDFVSFSYYNSMVSSHTTKSEGSGNLFGSIDNPYLESSE